MKSWYFIVVDLENIKILGIGLTCWAFPTPFNLC
jgi:hypothetical protein